MHVQQASDPSVEIDSATLDAGTKERALVNFQNLSCQTETIRMHETPDANAVANFHLSHVRSSRDHKQEIENYPSGDRSDAKEFLQISGLSLLVCWRSTAAFNRKLMYKVGATCVG